MSTPTSTLATRNKDTSFGERIVFLAAKGWLWLTSLLPLSVSRSIGSALGRFYYKVARKRVHIARINIGICFPELDKAQQEDLVKQSFAEAGQWVMESGALWYWPSEKILRYVTCDNPEVFERALAHEHGILLAIPHLGNWEIMGPFVTRVSTFACFYKHDSGNPLFNDYLVQLRSRNGTVMAPADPAGIRVLFKHLKSGKVAGLLPDHNPTADMGVFAPFFGYPALTGTIFSSLAKKNNAQTLTAAVIRTQTGFNVHFETIADQDSDDPVKAATALNHAIEHCIRLAPAQFQWVYPRFKHRANPATEKSPYR